MKKTIYKKPTLFQLTMGLLVSIGQSMFTKKRILVPVAIGKYRLISKVNKEIIDKEYGIGIYEYKGEKVFIKTWSGSIKNFRYYSLVKEHLVNDLLYKKLKKSKSVDSRYSVKIPQVVDYVQYKNSLSIVFEYIEGKTLSSVSVSEQASIISMIIMTLYYMSKSFTDKEKKQFSMRPFTFYVFCLPFYTLLTITSDFRSSKQIIKALINCLKTINHINTKNLHLAHGDLDLHNVIKNKSSIYILDWERTIFTIPNYDISYLSLYPNLKQLTKLVCKKLGQKPSIFIKNYLSIQLSKFFGDPRGLHNYS